MQTTSINLSSLHDSTRIPGQNSSNSTNVSRSKTSLTGKGNNINININRGVEILENRASDDFWGEDEVASTRGSATSAQSSHFSSNFSSASSNISSAIMKYNLLETLEIDLDDVDGLYGNGQTSRSDLRRWRRWKGINTFLCKGSLMLGPSSGHFLLTLLMVIGLWIGNLLLVGPFFESKIYYYLALILCTINVATLMVTAATDPGIIPRRNHRRVIIDSSVEAFLDINYSQFSFCKICNIVKPSRTKHCRLCDSCIQGFDHHCPWIGTCIGVRNYVFFIIFLSFLLVSLLFCMGSTLMLCMGIYIEVACNKPYLRLLTVALFFPTLLILLIFVGSLYFFHFYLALKGLTTSEFIRGTDNQLNSFSHKESIRTDRTRKKQLCILNPLLKSIGYVCKKRSSTQEDLPIEDFTQCFTSKDDNFSLLPTVQNNGASSLKGFSIGCSKTQLKQLKKFKLSNKSKFAWERICHFNCIRNRCPTASAVSNFDLERPNSTFFVSMDHLREKLLNKKVTNCFDFTNDCCSTICLGRNWMLCFLTRRPSLLLPLFDIEDELDLLYDIDMSIHLLGDLREKLQFAIKSGQKPTE